MRGIVEGLIGSWLLADLAVTMIQVAIAALAQGFTGLLVSVVENYAWGLIPFPFSLMANLMDPLWAWVEVGLFAIFAYLTLGNDGGGGLSLGGLV